METISRHFVTSSYTETHYHYSAWKRFISWAVGQQENRIMWLALAVVGHGCILTIATAIAVIFAGNYFIFWPFIIGAMGMALIPNLADMPTKITIPVFFFSILIDLIIIVNCFIIGFSTAGVYR